MTLSAIERNVALLKDHPALLGYYICDDCGPGVKMAPGYNTIRQLDPFHLTVGAGVRPIEAIRLFWLLKVLVADTGTFCYIAVCTEQSAVYRLAD